MAIPKIISTITATVFGTATTDDYLLGTSADDIISGGVATIAYVTDGVDTFQGGAGDDIYIVNDTTGSDVIIEFVNEGVDTVFSSVNYLLPSEVENIVAANSAAGVVLTGNSVANILDGSQSIDVDTLQGMEGNDTYIIGTDDKIIEGKKATTSATQYTDTGGIDTISSAATVDISALITASGQLVAGLDAIKGQAFIENIILTGSTAADITGNAKDNRLTGNSAANEIIGGAGNDTLDGSTNTADVDTLKGGVGNDTYIVRNEGDIIEELASAGTDTIISALAVDMSATALANIENITLIGISDVAATGNGLANTIKGNSGNNALSGGTGTVADILYGLQGNDTLDGGLGADKMYGGRGNDTYKVDNTGDVVDETIANGGGGSADLVESFVTYSLNTAAAADVEKLTLKGTAAINATGNALVNTLTGNSNANILDGGLGNDILVGKGGSDTYIVDSASDVITEAASNGTDLVKFTAASGESYTLPVHVENITLMGTTNIGATTTAHGTVESPAEVKHTMTGNSGNNAMTGGLNNDTLIGNAGNDTLAGGAGDDIITGGAGADTVTTGTGQDTIKFASGVTDTFTGGLFANIDLYSDLVLDNDTSDLIDLTVVIANIDTPVTAASIDGTTFITDMNAALGAAGVGFKTSTGDISAAVVTATAGANGVSNGDQFLAVDLDKSGTFTATDFVIEITGSTLTALDVSSFI